MKTILVLSVLVIITTPYCYSAAIEDTVTDTNTADTSTTAETNGMNIDFEAQTVNIIKENKNCDDSIGPQGIQGSPGPSGPPGGGALYTRWGRTICPDTNGTELVYKGLVAGSWYNNYGGGANYLCLTEAMKYRSITVPSQYSLLYGAEYEENVKNSLKNNNVPCAVCHTSQRSSKLMIPGTTLCPTSWTEEYEGYLMTARNDHKLNYNFECVDKDAEAVPGEARNSDGALFYHVGGVCNVGLPCPPMVAKRPITCVVCTK